MLLVLEVSLKMKHKFDNYFDLQVALDTDWHGITKVIRLIHLLFV